MIEKYLFVSTVGRSKAFEESSKVYKVDLSSGRIVAEVRLPLAMFDLKNPRGGVRGCRGLALIDGPYNPCLWAAGFDGLFCLDINSLFVHRGYWFESVRDIYNIYGYGQSVLVTSTWNNSIYRFDSSTGVCVLEKDITEQFPGAIRGETPDQYHLNSLCGDLILLNRQGAIANIKTRQIVYAPKDNRPAHDLVLLPSGEIAYCASHEKSVVIFNPETGSARTVLDLRFLYSSDDVPSGRLNSPGWTRGLSYSQESGLLYVGVSPASVFVVRPENQDPYHYERVICLSDDSLESVFAVIPSSL